MRWLHISDLHYGASDTGINTKELLCDFLGYINKNIKKPVDNLFITGDFRYAKDLLDQNETAEKAVKLIWEIAQNVGIEKTDQIHIVPGNHEGDKDNKEELEKIIDRYESNKGELLEGTFSDEDQEILAGRFSFFKKINSALYKGNSIWNDNLLPLHTYSCRGDYNLLYLNTAITCGRGEDERGKNKDRGNLFIGTSILSDTLAKIKHENPNAPIIVLAHHPIKFFNEGEREQVKKLFLKYNVILYLCGDTHKAKSDRIGNHIEINMGCLQHIGSTQEAFCEGEIKGDKIVDLRAHLWDIELLRLGEYKTFNDEFSEYYIQHDPETPKKTPNIPVNNLPDRNPRFSGRENKLNEIHDAFKKSGPFPSCGGAARSDGVVCLRQTITGLGGIGKTQIAIEYAHRFMSEYKDAIWWINAEKSPKEDLFEFADMKKQSQQPGGFQ